MGIKWYTVHYGPVSPRAVNGPRVTKVLIWAERRHGPYMGQKLQQAGIILDAQMKLLALIPIGRNGSVVSGP